MDFETDPREEASYAQAYATGFNLEKGEYATGAYWETSATKANPTHGVIYETGVVIDLLDTTDPRVSAVILTAQQVGYDLQTGQYSGDIVSSVIDVTRPQQTLTQTRGVRCIL